MNSERFMEWVECKLVPTFERKYPDHKMIMVADNAPYHHKREIGSWASLSKKKMVDLMIKYECNEIEVPLTADRWKVAQEGALEECGLAVQDLGDGFAVQFDFEQFSKRASSSNPFIPNLEELKLGFAAWLLNNKP
jgi:ribosomal protein L30E